MGRPIDLVIIGQISKDIILIDGRAETAPGGGVLYASYAAKATGAEILAVTKLAAEDAGLLSGFRERGIPVLDLPSPATTVMEDRFEAASGYRRRSRILSQATPFSLSEISVSRAGIYYLTALMHGEIPEAMIAELAGRGRVALDVQGFLRHREGELLVLRDWAGKERLLSRVSFLKADWDEARFLTGGEDLVAVVERIHRWGVREILITDTEGVTVSDGAEVFTNPFEPYDIRCRTGRGDTCFASFLGFRPRHGLQESLRLAAEITRRKLTYPGPYRGEALPAGA